MTRRVALVAALALTFASCSLNSDSSEREPSSSLPTGSSAADGPLANTRWPAVSIPTGVLLHDDGKQLWVVTLAGRRRVIWRHPRVRVDDLTAGPGGRTLAYSVSPERPADAPGEDSSFLYLLAADGQLRLVDRMRRFGTIASPVFLRAPTEENGPVRLYWLRTRDDFIRSTGRPQREILVYARGQPQPITTALRFNEGPNDLSGYPGSRLFTVTLLRRDNLPTRLEVVRNNDYAPLPTTSLTFWTQFLTIANTDVFTGVAWISPREYVVPVGHRSHPRQFSLRLFRVTCEYYGWHRVPARTNIDWGYSETPWPLLPGGPSSVLVLGAADAKAVADGRSKTARWLRLDVRTGAVTPTGARWRPGGWWTFVQPDAPSGPPRTTADANCGKYAWTYR